MKTDTETRVVKLRPGKGRRMRSGAPWLFADEVAMDRRTRSIEPGSIVVLKEGDETLGIAAFNPKSQICARLLDRNPFRTVDGAWFEERLRKALDLRDVLFPSPFYRLIHAEADGLPGVVIDRFGDALVVQPNAAWVDVRQSALIEAAIAVTGCTTVVVNGMSRVRELEGLPRETRLAAGSVDGPIEVAMNGAIYLADIQGGQKTGLFYDQRPNHAFAARLAKGQRVLDVFSHVGGFGLAALANDASSVLAVDASDAALSHALESATRMNVAAKFSARKADAFDAMTELAGQSFGLVVCDPPAFAPSKKSLPQGLRAYERTARLAAALTRDAGFLVLCSCSHAVGVDEFYASCLSGIRRAGRSAVLIHSGRAGPDHPVHPGLPETSYLKALFFRIAGSL